MYLLGSSIFGFVFPSLRDGCESSFLHVSGGILGLAMMFLPINQVHGVLHDFPV